MDQDTFNPIQHFPVFEIYIVVCKWVSLKHKYNSTV